MLKYPPTHPRPNLLRWGAMALAAGVAASLATVVPSASAAIPDGDEPGVTMRVYQLPQSLSELCTLKAGQTPNVDLLKPTIDWDAPEDFGGLAENFAVEALANLDITTAGSYDFRLMRDDGSELFIDGTRVIDNDGLHGAEPKDGTVELAAGVHELAINMFEAGGGEQLTLQWQKPASPSSPPRC